MEEGKLSRAMAKAGAGDKLASDRPAPATEPYPLTPLASVAATGPAAMNRAAKDVPPPARVKDRWGTPLASVALFHDKASQFASQMRGLRAKIMAMNHGRPPRVLTVTSGSRSEGKTTVSANLGAALSEIETGRVLIVDGDMLQPCQHAILNIQADTGLNDVLNHDLQLDGCIYETAIPNLDLLPAHPTAPGNNTETLLHQRCARLFSALQRHYAFIIVDTPPVLAGTQACAFGKHGDGIILVARLERTPRQVVKRALDELVNAGGKVVGTVLTHHAHHVPDVIYRFFGTTPVHYYRYYGRNRNHLPPPVEAGHSATTPEAGDKST